jgi:hypothetical protein
MSEAPVNQGTPLSAFGAKLYFYNNQGVDLSPYKNLSKAPVDKAEIYGQTLEDLLTQYSIVNQLFGSVDLLRVALERDDNSKVSSEDQEVLSNIQRTIDILHEVIVEKFAPRPR